jgi:hypothetical protein
MQTIRNDLLGGLQGKSFTVNDVSEGRLALQMDNRNLRKTTQSNREYDNNRICEISHIAPNRNLKDRISEGVTLQGVKDPRGTTGIHATRKREPRCSQPPLGGLAK